ncbi:hypothetical protein CORC01_07910 [Colletotrichum orchidophilum]|uniref:Small secreted protein n=1 Tax=Colletotrichum orchidophilum TaxID=1209926 RepID=A0A1G4B5T6_9PEZI|nr:uncharacterized protein CORC01_07910 [Colletotrichum orchidophilum]OHE96764.1 hypothetical protein CORC01_07910 [Colletotrichum orchidophilum]
MKFSAVFTTIIAVASAAPFQDISSGSKLQKRAAVFATAKTYDELSISGKNAGTAKEDALQKLSGLPTDLSQVDKADLTFLGNVNKIANDAERGAYNAKIAETAPGEDALALQRAKIQNKVLKLTASVLSLQAKQAQGKNVTAKLDTETKKLNKNIATDVANAGKPATALKFNASTDNPAAANVPKDKTLAAKAADVISQSNKAAGGKNGTATQGADTKGTGKKDKKTARSDIEAVEVVEVADKVAGGVEEEE